MSGRRSTPIVRLGDRARQGTNDLRRSGPQSNHAFVESAAVAVAVVPTDSKNDRTLLLHGDVTGPLGTNPVVHFLDLWGGRVPSIEREPALTLIFVSSIAND